VLPCTPVENPLDHDGYSLFVLRAKLAQLRSEKAPLNRHGPGAERSCGLGWHNFVLDFRNPIFRIGTLNPTAMMHDAV
jgi:hypothetical protein